MQYTFKLNMLVATLDERVQYERDQYKEFFNERYFTTANEDNKVF